jgi:hypothetical protein
MAKNFAKIKASFPGLAPDYFNVLSDMLFEYGFSDERLIDAVNHVISTCVYPQPTIANFLSFDKKVRLYTYQEMCDKVHNQGAIVWSLHDKVSINGKVFWKLIE